jgi:hypothetical protein
MKLVRIYTAVAAVLSMIAPAYAQCGAEKSCGCGSDAPVIMCRPVVCRPNYTKVCHYQRSNCKKVYCDARGNGFGRGGGKPQLLMPFNYNAGTCAAPGQFGSGQVYGGCAPAPMACGPANATCAAPAGCGPAPAHCAAPAAVNCAPAPAHRGPAPVTCAVPTNGRPAPAHCGANVPSASACAAGGCASVIADLIYQSQTACYARQRARALRRLGKFDCACNPEIMAAFTYGLNDCDERVRAEAARQIGCQLRRNPGCMNCKVFEALYCAMSDCDGRVRRAAEKALRCAGYEIANCNVATRGTTCAPGYTAPVAPGCGAPVACGPTAPAAGPSPAPAAAPVPAPVPEARPASTPAQEPEVYFPSRLKNQQTKLKSGLSNLFGLRS